MDMLTCLSLCYAVSVMLLLVVNILPNLIKEASIQLQNTTEWTVEKVQELINSYQTHSPELVDIILHLAEKGGLDTSGIVVPETAQQSQNEENRA